VCDWRSRTRATTLHSPNDKMVPQTPSKIQHLAGAANNRHTNRAPFALLSNVGQGDILRLLLLMQCGSRPWGAMGVAAHFGGCWHWSSSGRVECSLRGHRLVLRMTISWTHHSRPSGILCMCIGTPPASFCIMQMHPPLPDYLMPL